VPEQTISVGEALRAYTAGNAYATFDEAKRGTLARGGDADLVVLDRNLFTMPTDSLDRRACGTQLWAARWSTGASRST